MPTGFQFSMVSNHDHDHGFWVLTDRQRVEVKALLECGRIWEDMIEYGFRIWLSNMAESNSTESNSNGDRAWVMVPPGAEPRTQRFTSK